MAEALVSLILQQLASILRQQMETEGRLMVGVDEEVQKLTSNFQAIQAVVEDAEHRQVKEKAVRDWMDKLKDASYDFEDVLDEWNSAVHQLQVEVDENASKVNKKVCSLLPSYCFSPRQVVLRRDIAIKIKDLNKRLDNIAKEKYMFNFSLSEGTKELERTWTTSFGDELEVYGRDHDKSTIVNMLLSESNRGPSIPIISIIGMGGIGKTTLARLAFNDDDVNAHFDIKIWVCVSDPFDEIRVAKAILESIKGEAPNLVELENVLQQIHQSINKKKFFLVLDDVWTENPKDWEQLKSSLMCGSRGSRILITTRKQNVAKSLETTNMIPLGKLSDEECWSLFRSRVVFSKRNNEEYEKLKVIGRKIVSKCNGLPLAVKSLGSLLRLKTKIEEWQRVLESELWELEEVDKVLFSPLLLSYYDLPSKLRKCFLYCAIFPKDYVIQKNKLIKLWMAQGYLKIEGRDDMELVGEEYFENLAVRSFFQDFKRREYDGSITSCKMHDIVHDFAQFLNKNECITIEVDALAESQLQFSHKKARHAMTVSEKRDSFPFFIYNEIKLRSLVVVRNSIPDVGKRIDLSELFDQLTSLRTLDFHRDYGYSFDTIVEIPRGIKKLIHLRYLNLSKNSMIKELPETLCDLYNLETLDLTGCDRLQKLPEGIGKLINLRHLINRACHSVSYMPKGMERLTRLRTLTEFIISGSGSANKASTLQCLENFNHLQGSLTIRRLGHITDIDEAKQAALKRKSNLLALNLCFDKEKVEDASDAAVLEALQPHPNLERLSISWYEGDFFSPSWILSLIKLRELNLDCIKSNGLSSLGKLPSLESLSVHGMKGLTRLKNTFLGAESDSKPFSSSVIAFPKLKSLVFEHLHDWKEWDYRITRENDKWDYWFTGENDVNNIMPGLLYLKIHHCDKLMGLPNHILQTPTLKKLEIRWCRLLENRFQKGKGWDWHKISHIPTLRIRD